MPCFLGAGAGAFLGAGAGAFFGAGAGAFLATGGGVLIVRSTLNEMTLYQVGLRSSLRVREFS